MVSLMKKILVFLMIIVVISFLFNDSSKIESNTSVSEIIDIVDKDNTVTDQEIYVDNDVKVESDNNSNIFVSIVYFVSSIIMKIVEFISSFISSVLTSYVIC